MSAPGSPTSARRSPVVQQDNPYTSSYNAHFGSTSNSPRPSSAPASTSRRHYSPSSFSSSPSPYPYSSPYSPSPSYSPAPYGSTSYSPSPYASSAYYPPSPYDSPSSPSTPRSETFTPRHEMEHSTNRYGQYAWNKSRNPLFDGETTRSPTGKKAVPSYFENLEKFDEDTKRLSRKSRPEATPFMIDPSRAGIPTLIQKIRTREEDLFHRQRPSTAPSPLTRDDDVPAAGATPRTPSRRPCQIEKFNVRRNPLIEGGEDPTPRRQLIAFNRESEGELEYTKKTLVVPPSVQKVNRTTEHYIPGEVPPEPTVRLRFNHPEDSDVFNHSHPLVSPLAANLTGALDKEAARGAHERELETAYQQRVAFYNDEIKKFKAKAKAKTGGM